MCTQNYDPYKGWWQLPLPSEKVEQMTLEEAEEHVAIGRGYYVQLRSYENNVKDYLVRNQNREARNSSEFNAGYLRRRYENQLSAEANKACGIIEKVLNKAYSLVDAAAELEEQRLRHIEQQLNAPYVAQIYGEGVMRTTAEQELESQQSFDQFEIVNTDNSEEEPEEYYFERDSIGNYGQTQEGEDIKETGPGWVNLSAQNIFEIEGIVSTGINNENHLNQSDAMLIGGMPGERWIVRERDGKFRLPTPEWEEHGFKEEPLLKSFNSMLITKSDFVDDKFGILLNAMVHHIEGTDISISQAFVRQAEGGYLTRMRLQVELGNLHDEESIQLKMCLGIGGKDPHYTEKHEIVTLPKEQLDLTSVIWDLNMADFYSKRKIMDRYVPNSVVWFEIMNQERVNLNPNLHLIVTIERYGISERQKLNYLSKINSSKYELFPQVAQEFPNDGVSLEMSVIFFERESARSFRRSFDLNHWNVSKAFRQYVSYYYKECYFDLAKKHYPENAIDSIEQQYQVWVEYILQEFHRNIPKMKLEPVQEGIGWSTTLSCRIADRNKSDFEKWFRQQVEKRLEEQNVKPFLLSVYIHGKAMDSKDVIKRSETQREQGKRRRGVLKLRDFPKKNQLERVPFYEDRVLFLMDKKIVTIVEKEIKVTYQQFLAPFPIFTEIIQFVPSCSQLEIRKRVMNLLHPKKFSKSLARYYDGEKLLLYEGSNVLLRMEWKGGKNVVSSIFKAVT
jgi:hypothetical protein